MELRISTWREAHLGRWESIGYQTPNPENMTPSGEKPDTNSHARVCLYLHQASRTGRSLEVHGVGIVVEKGREWKPLGCGAFLGKLLGAWAGELGSCSCGQEPLALYTEWSTVCGVTQQLSKAAEEAKSEPSLLPSPFAWGSASTGTGN